MNSITVYTYLVLFTLISAEYCKKPCNKNTTSEAKLSELDHKSHNLLVLSEEFEKERFKNPKINNEDNISRENDFNELEYKSADRKSKNKGNKEVTSRRKMEATIQNTLNKNIFSTINTDYDIRNKLSKLEREKRATSNVSSQETEVTKTLRTPGYKNNTTDVSYTGPFFNFLVKICNTMLNAFSLKKIPKYFKIIGKAIKKTGSGFYMKRFIKRFSKKLIRLSNYRGELLKLKVKQFLDIITEEKPKRLDFFAAINSIYSSSLDLKMDSYIYYLRKYGKRMRKYIDRKTKHIFRFVIYDTLSKVPDIKKEDIQLKFMLAVIEYKEDEVYNSKSLTDMKLPILTSVN